jgi:SNF2 family DNA or RNA helicase
MCLPNLWNFEQEGCIVHVQALENFDLPPLAPRRSGELCLQATRTQILGDFRWETGDRFEVHVHSCDAGAIRLAVPPELLDLSTRLERLEAEAGCPLPFLCLADEKLVELSSALVPEALDAEVQAIWLEYLSPGRYRLIVGRPAPRQAMQASPPSEGASRAVASGEIEFAAADFDLLRRAAASVTPRDFELALRAVKLASHPGFDRLIALPMVRDMEVLEHQVRAATTVLRRMRGRALLCDEVGLGKTIEAGLVLSELLMRGLARSVLVLTPPSLITQWQGEMRRKFGIQLVSHDDAAFRQRGAEAWQSNDCVIVSQHTAKREPHRSAILNRKWDIVIVDEAHHLRNRSTAVWKFASEIQKQFILLLTATPVQNNLEELFNLVTLLEPGLLSTKQDFSRRFVSKGDKLTPNNVDELHVRLSEVMIRNCRSTVGLQFTRRFARTESVAMAAPEQQFYDAVASLFRSQWHAGEQTRALHRMTLITLQMALGSSSAAAAAMLEKLSDKPSLPAAHRETILDLSRRAALQDQSAKVDRLLELLGEFPGKLVIFTQFRATHDMLRSRLSQAGHQVAVFHGGLSRLEREAAIEHFRESARLLICTESGSEGRNLQFAHGVCNFDLPWNPMKIEQRIGRLSRIGQKRDVYVFNFVAAGTVEAAVLHLLEAKLNMFELVIGEVDMILGNLDEEKEFEDTVAEEWAASADAQDFTARMEALGNRLLAAKDAYFRQRSRDAALFGDRFAPEG